MNEIIAVATDGSPAAAAAVRWAAREAAKTGDRLVVIHAIEAPIPAYAGSGFAVGGSQLDVPALLVAARHLVDSVVADIRRDHPSIPVDGRIERGETGRVIIELARDARMLVVGTHRHRSPIADIMLGSTARHVLHHAPTTVVTVPPTEATGEATGEAIGEAIGDVVLRHVIVGVDRSSHAADALEWAAEEAQRWDADLEVIHSWEYPYIPLGPAAHQAQQRMGVLALEELDQVVAALHNARPDLDGVRTSPRIVCGSAAAALIDEAAPGDMIVVGTRGRGGFRSLVLGSVTQQVTQHAPCPVVVVRRSLET